ncbi:MAG: biotin transporter BioY [Clostridia bacterium]|nr:biotin transporter BioY [Clostridia bacterium]
MQSRSPSYPLALGALLCALTVVLAQVVIPIPPVPVSLSLAGVLLCGALLGGRQGALCMAVYLLMGLCGLPVFAGFSAGPGALLGPTGGFLVGYIPCAYLCGALSGRMPDAAAMAVGTAACYACGTAWYAASAAAPLQAALSVCVLPFLPGDLGKILLAALLARRLRPALLRVAH